MSEEMGNQSQFEELRALAWYLDNATYRTVETLALGDTEELGRAELKERLEAIRQMFLWRNEAKLVMGRYLSRNLSTDDALDALRAMRDDFERIASPVLDTPPLDIDEP